MDRKVSWKIQPNFKTVVFMGMCILVNYIGRFISVKFNLPFWMDSIGTCISSIMIGPTAGIIVGVFTNSVNLVVDITTIFYLPVSAAIAIVVAYLYPKERDMFQTCFTAFVVAIMSTIISVPVSMFLNNGYIVNLWGDALFEMLYMYNLPRIVCCFGAQGFIEIPDKILTLLIVYLFINWVVSSADKKGDEL